MTDRLPYRLVFALAIICPALATAEVSLPHILASHMVVQRDVPIHVWGRASAGEKVSAAFGSDQLQTEADRLGNWSMSFPPHAAGGPFVMTVVGTNSIKLEDILVGDVWVASGQSNMEFAVRQVTDADRELAKIEDQQLRLVRIEKQASVYPRYDAESTGWESATAASAREFSAVAYYFAREMRVREHVPVGVIESSWGGTPGEAWTSLGALASDAALIGVFSARANMIDAQEKNEQAKVLEAKATAEAKASGKAAPQFSWHPSLNSWAPGELYNAMIAPLTDLPIKGVIWYQGESNSALERAPLYGRLFQTLISDWRKQWKQPEMPFLFVQLANFRSNRSEDWATVREGQRQALELRNTGMAVTIDIGNPDDVHPVDKLDVGFRLALAARAEVFGESIEYSGPMPRDATQEGNKLRIRFSHGDGLMAKGGTVQGFEIAGRDGIFKPATAKIEGTAVVVMSDGTAEPRAVRYGWANSPMCNLFNRAQLPASPFMIEAK